MLDTGVIAALVPHRNSSTLAVLQADKNALRGSIPSAAASWTELTTLDMQVHIVQEGKTQPKE